MHPIFIFHTIPCAISEKTLASLRYAEVFLAMLTQFLVPSAKKRWLRFAMPKFSSQFLHNSLCHQRKNVGFASLCRSFPRNSYTIPCAIIALATFMKPAMLAPRT